MRACLCCLQFIYCGKKASLSIGNVKPIGDMPEGSIVCNVEEVSRAAVDGYQQHGGSRMLLSSTAAECFACRWFVERCYIASRCCIPGSCCASLGARLLSGNRSQLVSSEVSMPEPAAVALTMLGAPAESRRQGLPGTRFW